jgi:hypothetical protein
MKSTAGLVVAVGLLCAVTLFGQEAAVPLPPPATDTIAPEIPGVVKGGTKVQVVVDGLKHTDGPVAMRDGTLLYWDYLERRIGKIDPQGKPSTFLNNTDGASAMGFDSKGRLITTLKEHPPVNKIGVIWPKGRKRSLPTTSTANHSKVPTIWSSTGRTASISHCLDPAPCCTRVRVRR